MSRICWKARILGSAKITICVLKIEKFEDTGIAKYIEGCEDILTNEYQSFPSYLLQIYRTLLTYWFHRKYVSTSNVETMWCDRVDLTKASALLLVDTTYAREYKKNRFPTEILFTRSRVLTS